MGRKNNRRGCRPLNQDVIADILAEGTKKPQTTTEATTAAKTEPTEADRAHARAVEVCDRIVRELDEILTGGRA